MCGGCNSNGAPSVPCVLCAGASSSPCCPSRYLKRAVDVPCVWCEPCKAHCYNTPPKNCC